MRYAQIMCAELTRVTQVDFSAEAHHCIVKHDIISCHIALQNMFLQVFHH